MPLRRGAAALVVVVLALGLASAALASCDDDPADDAAPRAELTPDEGPATDLEAFCAPLTLEGRAPGGSRALVERTIDFAGDAEPADVETVATVLSFFVDAAPGDIRELAAAYSEMTLGVITTGDGQVLDGADAQAIMSELDAWVGEHCPEPAEEPELPDGSGPPAEP